MRVVVDVNVWISALLCKGAPGQILLLAQNRQITIFASSVLLQELDTRLRRNKFQPKLQSLNITVEALMDLVETLVELCPTTSMDVPQLRDPDDAKIIAAASIAKAEAIITGDLDLLTLVEFEGILILTPQYFLNRYFPNS